MQLTFKHTEKEYLSAIRLYLLRSKELLFRLILFYVMLGVGTLIVCFLVNLDLPIWVVPAFLILLAIGLYHAYFIDFPRSYFRRDPKFRDEYSLKFTDEGIGFKTQNIDAKVEWRLYTDVIENAEFFLLVYGKDLASVSILPKRAFKDANDEQEFRTLIDRHILKKGEELL